MRSAARQAAEGRSERGYGSYGKSEGKGYGRGSYGKSEGKAYGKSSFGKGEGKSYGRSAGKAYGGYGAEKAGRTDRTFRKSEGEKAYAPKGGKRFDDNYENPNLLIGRNPVTEAIKSGRTIDRILMQKDGEGSVKIIAGLARDAGIQLQYVDKIVLDKLAPGKSHQGVAAYVAAHDYAELDDILAAAEKKGEQPFLILLDGLEDPHNLGAILRSADGAGAHGVVIPSRRSVSLTDTVAKASAGAIEYVPVAKVSNLAQTIDKLKAKGIWVGAVDMGGVNYPDAPLAGPLAIVIGSEGDGISRLVKEKCDFVVGIPMQGKVNSLNASNAAAIVMYEAARQRFLSKLGK
ncbi:MAG: 23S rRNA (guanosine(2251)-2'-O)-methyltransferase RlmB [Firmicutes bacterium]|nr:23S rRNA (guanosine(2251)-2'-O)-methyltransferase RlmB [Bacillota bacterium]